MSDRDSPDSVGEAKLEDIPAPEIRTGQSAGFPELPERQLSSAQSSSRLDQARAAFDSQFPPRKRAAAATTDDLNMAQPLAKRSASARALGPEAHPGGRAKTTDDIDDSRRSELKSSPSTYQAPKTGALAMAKMAASSIKSAVTDHTTPFKDLGSAADILDRAKSKPDHELSMYDRIAMKHVDSNSSRPDKLAQIARTRDRFAASKKLTFASKLASAIDKTFNAPARKELSRRANMRSPTGGSRDRGSR